MINDFTTIHSYDIPVKWYFLKEFPAISLSRKFSWWNVLKRFRNHVQEFSRSVCWKLFFSSSVNSLVCQTLCEIQTLKMEVIFFLVVNDVASATIDCCHFFLLLSFLFSLAILCFDVVRSPKIVSCFQLPIFPFGYLFTLQSKVKQSNQNRFSRNFSAIFLFVWIT